MRIHAPIRKTGNTLSATLTLMLLAMRCMPLRMLSSQALLIE